MNDTLDLAVLRATLKSQYHAGLAMLKESIEACPDDLWLRTHRRNAFWQVAYHALFFTRAYLHRTRDEVTFWPGHVTETQNPDGIPGPPEAGSTLPVAPPAYTKAQVLAAWGVLDAWVDGAVDQLDLLSRESGFPWYKVSKLEHQLVNLRHLQHHAAQLADRLRTELDYGVKWVGARPAR